MANFPNIRRVESAEEMFRYKGVLWEPYYRSVVTIGEKRLNIRGPFCLKCRVSIDFPQSNGMQGSCPNCGTNYALEKGYGDLRQLAHIVYEGKLREGLTVISLDLPPEAVKASDEDDNYWIEARLGQKNGKKMAVVYFGEKKHGDQSKKDYSQIFIDFDDEQMRFDKGNKNPLEIIGKLSVEFLGSTQTSKKRD